MGLFCLLLLLLLCWRRCVVVLAVVVVVLGVVAFAADAVAVVVKGFVVPSLFLETLRTQLFGSMWSSLAQPGNRRRLAVKCGFRSWTVGEGHQSREARTLRELAREWARCSCCK